MKRFFIYTLCTGLIFSGCTVGPNYTKPDAPVPAEYKSYKPVQPAIKSGGQSGGQAASSKEDKNWKIATPRDHVPKGEWWKIFNDPVLNSLEEDAGNANQNLKAAVARVMQARSAAGLSRSESFPSVDMNPSARRSYSSSGDGKGVTANLFSLPFDLSYELDLWGRVRRLNEAAKAEVNASMSDYENVLLTLRADVARNYFQIRALDKEIDIVDKTLKLREESLRLTDSRFKSGYTDKLDVERARTELASTEAEAASLRKSRSELENSLAVLLGKPASDFKLAQASLDTGVPGIAPGLPSSLLERRPDVANMERAMAAANARIGVAKSAFFPNIRLTGSAGYQSGEADSLLNWSSRFWSLGAGASLPIFNGGKNRANMAKAEAAYDETVANYRQTVLKAFQEVEDGLTGLRFLNEQAQAQDRAVQAAANAESLSNQRYKSGLISYLDVVDTQRTALQTKRSGIQTWGNQLVTTIKLIKALGGGWEE